MHDFPIAMVSMSRLHLRTLVCAKQASTLLRWATGILEGASYLLGNLGSPGLLIWLTPSLWAWTRPRRI